MSFHTSRASIPTNVLVMGAGPAGLAASACLRRRGIVSTVLERNDRIAPSWYSHYARLQLHTPKRNSALPFLPMPNFYPRYPSRQQMIDYFEAYTDYFEINPHFHQDVIAVEHDSQWWHVYTQDTHYKTRFLVVATGYTHVPRRPTFRGQERFTGELLHSSQYRSGTLYRGQRVLVVGFGNSGGEIALDLLEHSAQPSLSVRGPVNILPRDLLGIPLTYLAIPLSRLPSKIADMLTQSAMALRYGRLSRYGLRRPAYGPFTQIRRDQRIPVLDVGTVAHIKRGDIPVYPALTQFSESSVVFSDGTRKSFDAVILATGFEPDLSPLVPVQRMLEGPPKLAAAQGLYFCGHHVVATGMLREIGLEAQRIAYLIASKQAQKGD